MTNLPPFLTMDTLALPRKQKVQAEKPEEPKLPNLGDRKVPTFDEKDVTVIFVLGKATSLSLQCGLRPLNPCI